MFRDPDGAGAGSGAKVVLDSSGPALKATIEAGGWRSPPSVGELRALTGLPLLDVDEIAEVGRDCRVGRAEMVAVTMGHEGAVLSSREAVLFRAPPPVPVRSATGAGDSFVGAMTLALAEGVRRVRRF